MQESGLFAKDGAATFEGLGLNERICRCLKDVMNLERPTEVQRRAVPVVLQGRDVMVRSQTGACVCVRVWMGGDGVLAPKLGACLDAC